MKEEHFSKIWNIAWPIEFLTPISSVACCFSCLTQPHRTPVIITGTKWTIGPVPLPQREIFPNTRTPQREGLHEFGSFVVLFLILVFQGIITESLDLGVWLIEMDTQKRFDGYKYSPIFFLSPICSILILPPFLCAGSIYILLLVSLHWKLNIDYDYKTKYAKILVFFILKGELERLWTFYSWRLTTRSLSVKNGCPIIPLFAQHVNQD